MHKSADIFSDPAQFRRYVLPPLMAGGMGALMSGINGPRGRKGLSALRGAAVGGIGGLGIVGGRELARATFENPIAAYGMSRFTGPLGGYMAFNAADAMIPQVQPLEEDHAVSKKDTNEPKAKEKKDEADMSDKDTKKQADLLGAAGGSVNMGLTGGMLGAGAGGLYGLLSGALGSRKGHRIRDTLVGGGRGVIGGGLLGGGAGAGLGLSLGGHIPVRDFLSGDIKRIDAARDSMKKIDPRLFAGLTTASTLGGAALGGMAADSLLNPKEKQKEQEDADKQAELTLLPNTGIKQPQPGAAAKHVNDIIEKARKKREAQEKAMSQQNKAANADDYRSPFSESKFENIGVPAIAGAGLGGIYGALTAPKKQLLRSVLRGSVIGGSAGAGAGVIGSSLAPALAQNELNRAGSKPEFLDGFHAGTSTGLSAGGGGLVSGLLAKRLLDEYVPLKNHEEEKKTANDGWRPFDYSKVGPGGLISQRTLPKSDGTGGAKSWKPAVNAPPSSHPSFQQPGAGSRLVPVPQPQQPKLVPVAAGGKTASAYEFGKMVKRSDFMSGLQSVGDYAKGVWNSPGVQGFVNDPTTRAGLTYGGIGAGLGGLYGLINPGEYEDEYGNVRRRGRLMGALRGALGGGALGGLAGAGAQEGRFQYLKHLANQANNASGVPAAPGMGLPTDRAGWQAYSEQFAPDYLKTSPLQSAQSMYSNYLKPLGQYLPKPMGKAPATGVDTPAKAPEVKTTP